MAVIQSAFTDAPPPYELVRAWMCEAFHALPSQVDNEEADMLLTTFRVMQLYHEYARKRK